MLEHASQSNPTPLMLSTQQNSLPPDAQVAVGEEPVVVVVVGRPDLYGVLVVDVVQGVDVVVWCVDVVDVVQVDNRRFQTWPYAF